MLCVRGDQHVHGVDFFEALLCSSVDDNMVDAHSRGYTWFEIQARRYYYCLCPADVEEGKNIYVEMPCGFRKLGKVLKLIKTLYGLQQSPRVFCLYLAEKMNLCGMEQLTFDPCIFIGTKIMCICYLDHLIFWALDKSDINGLANQLITSGVSLEQESDAARFLGVRMETNPTTGLMELKQTGLIDRVIETLGLDISTTSGKFTPAEAKPLVKDANGEPALADFSYSKVVGMLLYLPGHTRHGIVYALNCCARYMFCPKRSHELGLKWIG